MKRIIAFSLAAGLLASTASTLVAQVSTNAPTPAPGQSGSAQTPDLRSMTPQERRAYLKSHPELAKQVMQRREVLRILGLNAKELRSLPQAERRDKIREAAKSKIADLKQKKESGTLTAQEQTDLDLLQKFLKRGHAQAKPSSPGSSTSSGS